MAAIACLRVLADDNLGPAAPSTPGSSIGFDDVVAKLTAAFLESRWTWPRRQGRIGPSAFLLVDPRALTFDADELRGLAYELQVKLFGVEGAGEVCLLLFEGQPDEVTRFATCGAQELNEALEGPPGGPTLNGRVRRITATAVEVVAHKGDPAGEPPNAVSEPEPETLPEQVRPPDPPPAIQPPTNRAAGGRDDHHPTWRSITGSLVIENRARVPLADSVSGTLAARRGNAQEIETEEPKAGVDRWTPFMASNGRRVRVSCVLEPVFELKNYGRIGNRIARRVLSMDTEEPLTFAEIQNLSRSDIEKIDFATIARGLDRLRVDASAGPQPSLIIPVSYVSLSNRLGRAALAGMFKEARTLVRAGVICEVCDIEGVPQNALLAATSLIKSDCMFLTGRLAASPERAPNNLRDAGLQALSFEAPQGPASDAEFLDWARTAIGAAKLITKSVMIYRISSARHAGVAALLGATHASLRAG